MTWGAKTLAGTGITNSPWNFIANVRTANHIRRSLTPALAWSVYIANGPTLWAAVTAQTEKLLIAMSTQGALLSGPGEGYRVVADNTTMTAADITAGRLVLVVSVNVVGFNIQALSFAIDLQVAPG
jgi:phage tail sheath protein FI